MRVRNWEIHKHERAKITNNVSIASLNMNVSAKKEKKESNCTSKIKMLIFPQCHIALTTSNKINLLPVDKSHRKSHYLTNQDLNKTLLQM